jgi:hypothetical protein
MPEIFKVSWIRHSLNCLGFAVVGFGIPIGLARSNHLTGGALLFFALFLLLIVWGFFGEPMTISFDGADFFRKRCTSYLLETGRED